MTTVLEAGPEWRVAVAPTPAELDAARAELGLPEDVVGHALDPNERPRVKTIDGVTFLVLRVPYADSTPKGPSFDTVPLGILAGPRGGIVTCTRDCPTAAALARLVGSEPSVPPQRLLLRSLELAAEDFLRQLDAIERAVDATEKELAASLENRGVLVLLEHQKSLVHFSAALDGAVLLLTHLPKSVLDYDPGWLADIEVELRQARDTAILQRNVLSEMMDAFASIISNNLNVVMKFLAAATVLLTIPMIVASAYGMNVPLPGQGSAHAFLGTIVASVVGCLLVAAVFRRHGWL